MALLARITLRLGLGTAEINTSAKHIGFLYVLNEVLRNGFVLKGYKTEPSTCISVGLLHDLDVFNNSVLAEKARKLVLIEVIVKATNKHLIASTPATGRALTLPVWLFALPVAALVLLPIATAAATASLFTIASAAFVIVVVFAALFYQK